MPIVHLRGGEKEDINMPRTKEKRSRNANGSGAVHKKTVIRNGKKYIYWEGRYTEGYDPSTGKQIQRSITGKKKSEVAEKLRKATAAIDAGTYTAPSKMTLGQWLDIWLETYLIDVKPRTVESYLCQIKNHIRPDLGTHLMEKLDPHMIQRFYNNLSKEHDGKPGLSPRSIKVIHGILHKVLEQAVTLGYLRTNPADKCVLPRGERRELNPLDEDAITLFMKAVKGHPFERIYLVTLFTGIRQGEVLGLTWDCVDLDSGIITINKQIQKETGGGSVYHLVPTKNSKWLTITPAAYVIKLLRGQKRKQAEWQLKAGQLWENSGLVFTNELGVHLMPHTVYHNFKKIVASIGIPNARFHDLRHSYAVAAIRSGDDIKTVQGNLGHATASFTLDKYGHVTDQMKRASADRMQDYIDRIKKSG